MFEIGWTEILFVGLVAVLVLKPKDYPEMMRSIGQFLAKARSMAAEFQGQFNDAMKDANLQDVKKTIDELRDLKNMGPMQQVKDTFVKMADEAATVRKEIEGVTKGTAVGAAGVASTTGAPEAPAAASASSAATVPPPVDAASVLAALPTPPAPTGPPTELVPAAQAPAPQSAPDAAPPKANGGSPKAA